MSRKGPGELAAEVGPEARGLAGLVRRMAISLTSRVLWQLTGHRLPDGSIETRDAEVFGGIGFYARPPNDGKPEAIVVFPGSVGGGPAGGPVVIALRDEKTRAAVAGGLEAGETAVFNGGSIVVLKANGDIEIRSKDGIAQKLATITDLLMLGQGLANAAIAVGASGAAAVVAAASAAYVLLPPPLGGPGTVWPKGTTKLKAE